MLHGALRVRSLCATADAADRDVNQPCGDSMNSEPPLPKPSAWIPATFRALLEGAPDAMLIVDQDGRIVLANNQAAQLFGYASGELDGQKVEMLVPTRYRYK